MSSYITSILKTKLNSSGRNYVFYDTADEIPEKLSDLPQVENTIHSIVRLSVKSRSEIIDVHNVTYNVTVDFLVPAQIIKEFQQDMDLLKDLEEPINLVEYSLKMIFPVSARYMSQVTAGQYWVSYSVMGEAIEFDSLTFGEDVELYYMLNEDECIEPTENPNDYIGTNKVSSDGSVWAGVVDFHDWVETEDVILEPTYTVNSFADLPQAAFGESAKVADTFVWDDTTSHLGDYGYIRDTLSNLGLPTVIGIKAVATGHVMVNSSDIEWNSGYEIQWISQVSLDAPYDYDIVSPSTLPTPTSNGLKGRIRTLAWQSNTFHFSDYGYIKTSLGALPTGIAHLGKKATVIGYTPVLTTVTEYNAAPVKADILTDDSWTPSNVDDMLFNFQNEYDMYFSDLPEFAYQGAIKFNNGVTISYWKFDIATGNANVYYTYNVTDTDYFLSQTIETKPRITVSVTEGWNNNDVWQRIQVEHFTVFNALVDFYDDLGVIRVNTGFGYEYRKLTQTNRLGNLYYISIVETYKYYYSTPSASWEFINSGEGELIDIESWDDGTGFTVDFEYIKNDNGEIKQKKVFYTTSDSTISFMKLLNPSKVFDNLLLKARHQKDSPKQIILKFKYNASVYSLMDSLEHIENYYILNVSRTRSKRTIGALKITLGYGELL
jgi:hypothetical protein